jgi:hypothetical protein
MQGPVMPEQVMHLIALDTDILIAIAGLCVSVLSGAVIMAWTVGSKIRSLEVHFDALGGIFQKFDKSNDDKHTEIIDSSGERHREVVSILKAGEKRFDDHETQLAVLNERTKE